MPRPRPCGHDHPRGARHSGIAVFLGLDVGKEDRHGHGLPATGNTDLDRRLPNTEPRPPAVSDKLRATFGSLLVIADQRAPFGVLH